MITEIEVCTPFFIFDAVCMFISGGALYFTVGKLIEIKNHWWTKYYFVLHAPLFRI